MEKESLKRYIIFLAALIVCAGVAWYFSKNVEDPQDNAVLAGSRNLIIDLGTAGKAYRYCVKAYRIVNGTKTVTKTSNTVHSITTSSKFTNAKSVTVSETSVALQVGEPKNLGAKVVAADANRTLLTHTAELVYKSGSSKVATVSKDGTVTAVGKGTCRIYVTAGSGASATVTVTVK